MLDFERCFMTISQHVGRSCSLAVVAASELLFHNRFSV
jgi:hypothetical protein